MMFTAFDPQERPSTRLAPTQDEGGFALWVTIALLSAVYIGVVSIGNRRIVWFDELFTLDIARSASLQQLWYRLRFDLNPPTFYLLSRISMSAFGATPFGLRFPSMVEFYIASIATLMYVRRKAGLAFATVAVLMVWTVGPTLYYAVEARAYALLFMAYACLLLSWDTAIHARPRGWALLGVALSTLILAVAHVFAPFTLFAFLVAEAVRFYRRKRADYQLWMALLVPMSAMLLYIPLIRLYGGIIFAVYASYNTILAFYTNTFGASILLFAVLAALVVSWRRQTVEEPSKLQIEEFALLGSFVLSPVLLNLVLIFRRGTFYDRYCIASQVAMLAALAIFLAYRTRFNRLAAYAAATVLLLALLKDQVWHPLRYPVPQGTGALAEVQPSLPVVAAEAQVFMEMNQRESQPFLKRLYFLKDQQASLQYVHTNLFQDFEGPDVLGKAGFPFTANLQSYSEFTQANTRFLLLANPAEWVFQKLLADGASVAFVHDYSSMPYFDRTLCLVTMPHAEVRAAAKQAGSLALPLR